MMEIVDINTTQLLPQGIALYGPLTEEEYQRVTIQGRAFRLTRMYPQRYVEYFVEPTQNEGDIG